MHDLEWPNAPAPRVPANDNRTLRNASDRIDDASASPIPPRPGRNIHEYGAGVRTAPGRTADIIALVAVLLWQFSFLVLLFALM